MQMRFLSAVEANNSILLPDNMFSLQDLFIEYSVGSLEELIEVVNNRIELHDEDLRQDMWNSWAFVSKKHYQSLLTCLEDVAALAMNGRHFIASQVIFID